MQPLPILRARSYAKINLYLDVLPPRPDGFHDIETIFQSVSLCDELAIERTDGPLTLTCSNAQLDCGATNLVLRAAVALRERTGCTAGATMALTKRIPIAAGLAGGSGNAAAALSALNELWGLERSPSELAEIGLALGSDVPYCLRGGTVAATGRGEIMRPLESPLGAWFVLVHPNLHVSTRDVYTSPLLQKNREARVDGVTPSFRQTLERFKTGNLPAVLFNRMEGPVFAMHPQLADIKRALLDAGCTAPIMSGSGPTVFGLCASEVQARGVATTLAPLRTTVVTTVPHGIELSR
ncbi:MAG: 4-(cytidine 5'-diphospho)-2-C-methyl-D-erythritol kinase [Candidatus Hydrogenedentes bacterium]|nr:4-(cytidine 5'-diphospho)-2-C-methyl-D-erythritol kinase [Candidatus Hydrogenedentota bacterium]